jgi:hypothetical protein
MLTNDITLETLKEYLQKKYDINPESINSETSLLNDLGIKGDDVDDFFSSVIEDFKIEVKRLNLSRFNVGEEPYDFISPIVRLFKREKVSQKPTITISDIKKFIQSGILE